MKTKTFLMLTLALAVAGTIAGVFFASRQKTARPNTVVPAQIEIQPAVVSTEVVTTTAPEPPAPDKQPGVVVAPTKADRQPKPQNQNSKTPKEPLQDPDARAALSLVGADRGAEAYWLAAISDTSLPDNEREDLMEDLNEEGLSDPKHPGPEDLPLILNRLVIIEQIAPYADDFMLEHLGEADKDLRNLLAGKP